MEEQRIMQPGEIKTLGNGKIDYDYYNLIPMTSLGIANLAFQQGQITTQEFSDTMNKWLISFKSNYQN